MRIVPRSLVKRLHECKVSAPPEFPVHPVICDEAADEIERLADLCGKQEDEIELWISRTGMDYPPPTKNPTKIGGMSDIDAALTAAAVQYIEDRLDATEQEIKDLTASLRETQEGLEE